MAPESKTGSRHVPAESLLSIAPGCFLKLLEEPAVYNSIEDELYFVTGEALGFLEQCGSGAGLASDAEEEFLRFCLDEGILIPGSREPAFTTPLQQSPLPSLRYLLLHVTDHCNLRCRHCFVGEPRGNELSLEEIQSLSDQFEAMQGLRLIISGGEPLLHSRFREIDRYLSSKSLRVILLTNGTLIDEKLIDGLHVDEFQLSLDGMREAHDFLRGPGAFDRTLSALKLLTEAGFDVSVATMVHKENLGDFPRLAELLREYGVREWSIDQPALTGRLALEPDLVASPSEAAPLLDRSYGGAIHEPFPGFACGTHLMAVMADGSTARCGFYAGQPVGHIREGLNELWQRVPKIPLAALSCDCQYLSECRGGCRFRAAGYNEPEGPDLCQCYRYGVL